MNRVDPFGILSPQTQEWVSCVSSLQIKLTEAYREIDRQAEEIAMLRVQLAQQQKDSGLSMAEAARDRGQE